MTNAFVKIGTALLKHQVKKLVGEETLGVISDELADIGGDRFDSWLDENKNESSIIISAFLKRSHCFM